LKETGQPSKEAFRKVASEIHQAFSQIGFVYLINHGISKEQASSIFQKSRDFFLLPLEVKEKYKRLPNHYDGYLSPDKEILQSGVQTEMKESYSIGNSESIFPSQEDAPGFKQTCLDFLSPCVALCRRFLVVLALSLDLAEDFFLKRHKELTKYKENPSSLRILYYPPVTNVTDPTTVRCSEHSDFGTVTFLFQDSVGGLEVKTKSGEWIPATPLEGAILVNVGDLLAIWSDGLYPATPHRILVPREETKKRCSRSSLAYFVLPDDIVMVEPLDGSNRFPTVNAAEYLSSKLKTVLTYI
ncbi:probable iron/ascorbate oxidoreductase DDB_G0283291, partial [Limulus polyphemus]|uniref:Probable iron/ascorbate oxidoreductase DDB_G0283291 n=1 Tax=Limulus polyphemus TaxID=6850 RepID=A0ABM1C2L9_LIMPO